MQSLWLSLNCFRDFPDHLAGEVEIDVLRPESTGRYQIGPDGLVSRIFQLEGKITTVDWLGVAIQIPDAGIGPQIAFDESFSGSRDDEIGGRRIIRKLDPWTPGEQLDQFAPQV